MDSKDKNIQSYIRPLNHISLLGIDGINFTFPYIYHCPATKYTPPFLNLIKNLNTVNNKIKDKPNNDIISTTNQSHKKEPSNNDHVEEITDSILNLVANDTDTRNSNVYSSDSSDSSDTDSLKSVDLTENIEKIKSVGTQYNINDCVINDDTEWIFVKD